MSEEQLIDPVFEECLYSSCLNERVFCFPMQEEDRLLTLIELTDHTYCKGVTDEEDASENSNDNLPRAMICYSTANNKIDEANTTNNSYQNSQPCTIICYGESDRKSVVANSLDNLNQSSQSCIIRCYGKTNKQNNKEHTSNKLNDSTQLCTINCYERSNIDKSTEYTTDNLNESAQPRKCYREIHKRKDVVETTVDHLQRGSQPRALRCYGKAKRIEVTHKSKDLKQNRPLWRSNPTFIRTYSRKLSFKDPDDSMEWTTIEPGLPEDNIEELRATEALKKNIAAVESAVANALVEEHENKEIRELRAINKDLRRQNRLLRIENFKLQMKLATVTQTVGAR